MRISSSTIFDTNVAAIEQQQARLLQTQQQVSTGRRIISSADDPAAAARALDITQSDAANSQYTVNRNSAKSTLSMAESNLQSVTTLLQDIKTALVDAGNGTHTDSDRKTIATQLSGRLQELLGLANSTDGAGNYLFSGFQSRVQPFVDTPAGTGYFGDDGPRNVQVSATRQINSSDSGADLFMRIRNGNGTFVTQPGGNNLTPGPNLGTGVISAGSIGNPPPTLPINNYSIAFTVTPGVGGASQITTYSVTNTTTATVVSTGNSYVSGQIINVAGMQFNIQGAPANGDTFMATPSVNQSVFKTISDLITVLNTPIATAANGGTTTLVNSLSLGMSNLDNALDNILKFQTSQGLRMNEIDSLQTEGDSLGVQFKQALSQLQDVDYNKAVSDLTLQQMSLQAAQKSFAKISDLSLFSYL